jgi:hypothetical protein
MTPMPDLEPGAAATLVHLGRLPAALRRGLLLIGEVVVVPGSLLYAFVAAGHPMMGILAVFAWRTALIGSRVWAGIRVPATCWLTFGLFLARTVAGIAVSSVSLYLLVPVVLCAGQGLFFIGSSFSRRPLLMRLAADYTARIPDRPELRRVFAQMCVIWGGVHLACAAMGAWALTLPSVQAVAVTSTLGLVCSLASVGGCAAWGLWRACRIPGLRVVCSDKPAHDHVPAHGPAHVAVPVAVPAAA